MEEKLTLATDAAYVAAGLEGPAQLALSRAAFAQLRHLVVDDRLDTPPSIPVDCFDDSPSEKSAALAFYERLGARGVDPTAAGVPGARRRRDQGA